VPIQSDTCSRTAKIVHGLVTASASRYRSCTGMFWEVRIPGCHVHTSAEKVLRYVAYGTQPLAEMLQSFDEPRLTTYGEPVVTRCWL